jgi:S-adenosylmethionine hydrolase
VQLITLTTDFGTRDWFVGTMKGVILGLQPRATIVDLTHEIPAGDVRAGAFALTAGCRFFPKGTVHVAVVDPGVGSARRAIAVQTEKYFFVGPDNGVLSFALAREKIKAIRQLTNEKFFLKNVSQTFHGRDLFAPVAAHLSRGVPIQRLGPALKDFVWLDWPRPRTTRAGIQGEVVYIDRFGNAITNILNEMLQAAGARTFLSAATPGCSTATKAPMVYSSLHTAADRNVRAPRAVTWTVFAKGKPICSVEPFYQSVRTGQAVAVPGSSGFLEIAVNGGSAEETLGLKIGRCVELRPASCE